MIGFTSETNGVSQTTSVSKIQTTMGEYYAIVHYKNEEPVVEEKLYEKEPSFDYIKYKHFEFYSKKI